MEDAPKPVRWIGSSRKDLRSFPKLVQRHIGQALWAAQRGEEYPTVKALKGFGGRAVLEIVAPHDTDTYRSVYTVRFHSAIYVLHCFQKEIEEGHGHTEEGHRPHQPAAGGRGARPQRKAALTMKKKQPKITVEESSGNIFADLGFPNPEREEIKARLTLQIYRLITQRGLTQAAAGEILGIKQPHVSGLMRGQSGAYSVERLMEFLAALGQDVQITVRPTRKKQPGHVSVVVP
jgi:phage-related protein/predicted XRE-type DNA-binding protein